MFTLEYQIKCKSIKKERLAIIDKTASFDFKYAQSDIFVLKGLMFHLLTFIG